MLKRLILYILFFGGPVLASAQDLDRLLQQYNRTGADTNHISASLQLAAYYLNMGDTPVNMDSAAYYIRHAEQQSRRLQLELYIYKSLRYRAIWNVLDSNYSIADQLFTQVADLYTKAGNKMEAAFTWRLYGDCFAWNDFAHAALRRKAYETAYNLYKQTPDKQQTADLLGKVADADLNIGNLDSAETELLSVIAQYKALKFPRIYYGYYLLAQVYSRKNLVQQLKQARLETATAFEEDPDGSAYDGGIFYGGLGNSYLVDKEYGKALEAYTRSVTLNQAADAPAHYFVALNYAAKCYAALHRYREGLAFLRSKAHVFPYPSRIEERSMLMSEIALNTGMGNKARVEAIIQQLKPLDQVLYDSIYKLHDYYSANQYVNMGDPLMRYYIQTAQWDRMNAAYQLLDALPKKDQVVAVRQYMLEYAYYLDSARGDYLSAMDQFRMLNQINDSINKVNTSAQINELETRYRTLAKDKTIQLLNNQAAIQQERLDRRSLALNVTLGGVLLLVILAVVMYYAYKGKQRANKRLSEQQEEINAQNLRLSALLDDKEKLLEEKDELISEKEWLLREVHHRVKNNLQLVISLLYNQSAYLDHPAAIKAIRDIQNRIQAIAIIHQKLYRKPGVNAVSLQEYVRDLVGHLGGVYGPRLRRIRFIQDLDAVPLDPAQAVPLGLILNEAVTNAIKYAFDETGGTISITGHLTAAGLLKVVIADNGKGFDEAADPVALSLGMEMMKALARQLNGQLEMKNDGGAVIIVTFRVGLTDVTVPENKVVPVG